MDRLRWNALYEGGELATQVGAYRTRYNVYPEAVLGDPIPALKTTIVSSRTMVFVLPVESWAGRRKSPQQIGKN